MRIAIIGLAGAIIGGLITGSFNYFLERVRDRHLRQRERDNQAIEIRRAARLIDAELLLAAAVARTIIRNVGRSARM